MNLRNITHTAILCFTLFVLSACCNIYDDLSSCPQGIAFTFRSETPCGDELSLENMKQLHVGVYDQSGKEVATFEAKDIIVTGAYSFLLPFDTPGTYTFAFWGMENTSAYSKTDDAALQLNHDMIPVKETLPALFFGASAVHTVENRSEMGTKIDTLAINMLPYVYTVNVQAKGLPADKEYTLKILDNNAKYGYDGTIIPTPVTYAQPAEWDQSIHAASFTTLKLVRNSDAIIRVKTTENKVITEIPLEEIFKGIEQANNIRLNLGCMHKLDIVLEMQDDGTYQRIMIRLNDWNFIYRKVILSE